MTAKERDHALRLFLGLEHASDSNRSWSLGHPGYSIL